MAESKNNAISLLARNVDNTGDVTADAIASTVSLGATVYDSIGQLPMSGYTAGEQAFVKSTSRLYINSGVGWYNVAVINNTPTIQSILDSDSGTGPFSLATDGTATTITITAQDSDGDTLTYTASADSDFNGLATLSQASNVFTITPFSSDSATTQSGTITFNVTDNINIANSVQTFTLNFLSALWDETVLSIGTSSTNGLDNSTFIDQSTSALTVTPSGSPVQTSFHPYLDNWSVEFDGSGDYLNTASVSSVSPESGDFTLEFNYYYNGSNPSGYINVFSYGTAGNALRLFFYTNNTLMVWRGSTPIITSTNNALTPRVWQHVAIVRESSTITLYVDGVSVGSTTDSSTFDTGPLNIGFESGQALFTGNISNFRLVKGTALYTTNFASPTEKLTAVSGTSLLTCQSNRFIDNSSSAHTITVNGNPEVAASNPFGQGSEYAVGENKGSVLLDGSSNYMTISDTTAFDFSSGYTCVEAWIYPNSIATGGGRNHIFTRGQSVSPYNGVYLRLENGYPDLAGSNNDLQSPTICKANEWSHVVFQFNPNGEQSIWLNGVRVADRSNGPSTVEVDVTNGIGHYDGGGIFDGYISDLKIRNGVTAFYSGATITVPQSPLNNTNASLYLPMDNAGIFDQTGNNTLTLFGNTSTSTTQTKYANTAMYFDGSGDYILSGPNELYDRDFTIELWWYPTSTARQALMHGSWGNDWSIGIDYSSVSSNQKIGIWASSNGSSWNLINSDGGGNGIGSETINQNAWNHIAYTRSGTTWRLFVNGVLDVELTGISGSIARPTQQIAIGAWWSTGQMSQVNGYIENFQILKGVAKYTANFTPPIQTQGREYQAES